MSTAKSGSRWSPEEDSRLLGESQGSLRASEIAETHERTSYAIIMRLALLFLQGQNVTIHPEDQEFYEGAIETVLRSQEDQKRRRALSEEKRALKAATIQKNRELNFQRLQEKLRLKKADQEAKRALKEEKIRAKEEKIRLKEEKARLRAEKKSKKTKGPRKGRRVRSPSPSLPPLTVAQFSAQYDEIIQERIVPHALMIQNLLETRHGSPKDLALNLARLGERIMVEGFELESFARKRNPGA